MPPRLHSMPGKSTPGKLAATNTLEAENGPITLSQTILTVLRARLSQVRAILPGVQRLE